MRILFIFLLTALFPLASIAMPKALDDYPENICDAPVYHTASIVLQGPDKKLLSRVRALKSYLSQRGQDPALVTSLYKAALKTGVDFDLLILKAMMESDLGRMQVAPNSSARGVFQYIDQTWLGVVKHYGARIGYPHYAQSISFNKRGLASVNNDNPFIKAEILSLRYDPEVSALIKAYQILDETAMIRHAKGSKVETTDHYIAHMMGMPLAKEFYKLRRKKSVFALAKIGNPAMREAARMNKHFFYKSGRALTASESYKRFEARVNREIKKIETVSLNNKDAC